MYKNLPKFNESSYTHFITTRTYGNYPYFKDKILCRILIEELEFYSKKYDFYLIGYVIMPDHLHLLLWWDYEENQDLSISKVMNSLKTMTAKRVKQYIFYNGGTKYTDRLTDVGQPTRRPFSLWQKGFYDYNIYSENKLLEKLKYIHNNPVKAGLVSLSEYYEWSSWRMYYKEDANTKECVRE